MDAADITPDGNHDPGPSTSPVVDAVTVDAITAEATPQGGSPVAHAVVVGGSGARPLRSRPPVSVISQSGLRRPPVSDWDRYHIEGFLGAGGMGSVFKARDPRLGRFVALKFLRDGDALPEQRRRFDREARAQARLDHPNICKIFEVGEVDGHPYLAMQYLEGQPLSAIKHELTVEQKVKLMREVATALHAAHREGLIHRDVKPGYVRIDKKSLRTLPHGRKMQLDPTFCCGTYFV